MHIDLQLLTALGVGAHLLAALAKALLALKRRN